MTDNINNDSFGLNIVCEVPSAKPASLRKKLNKYDRGRLRKQRKKQVSLPEIQLQQHQIQRDTVENGRKILKHDTGLSKKEHKGQEKKPMKKEVKQQEESKERIGGKYQKNDEDDGSEDDDQSEQTDETESSEENFSLTKEQKESDSVEVPEDKKNEIMTQRPVSRRNPEKMLLDETTERARYMAEFHARPMEMDRRSGATVSGPIKVSQPSNHIFVDENNETVSLLPGLLPRLHQICERRFHMTQATWIQSKTWQYFFPENKENLSNVILMQSETGSGKTAAYLLPILQKLTLACPSDTLPPDSDGRKSGGTQCVILAPTRELTVQIYGWVEALTQPLPKMIVGGCLSGGESRKSEKARLRKGLTVLVATPGRWLDHYAKTESLKDGLTTKAWCNDENNNRHKFLILDESDRLLDQRVLGVQMQQIIQYLHHATSSKSKKQQWKTILASATLDEKNKSYQECIKTVLGENRSELNPKQWTWIRGAPPSESIQTKGKEIEKMKNRNTSTPRQLNQFHMMVTAKLRLTTLIAFLIQRVAQNERTVVFLSTCDSVDYHYKLFQAMECLLPNEQGDDDETSSISNIFGCPIFRLHGKVKHSERHSILSKISALGSGKRMVLLATDVAARGLNIGTRLDWTVQYDPPSEIAEYIHRVGRSARAGHAGNSLLFLLPSEQAFLAVLSQHQGNSVNHNWTSNIQPLSLTKTLQNGYKICRNQDWLSGSYNRGKKNKTHDDNNRDGEAFTMELQKQLEDLVLQQKQQQEYESKKKKGGRRQQKEEDQPEGLYDLACLAYFSHLRAYPTKEKLVRHIFSARALHLGHLARSLALREMPNRGKSKKSKAGQKRKNSIETEESHPLFLKGNEKKKQKLMKQGSSIEKTVHKKKRHIKADGTVDTAIARRMLMEQAQKLQQGGMGSF